MPKMYMYALSGFILGAAIGSIVTLKFVETKYQEIADEEIADVKNHYSKMFKTGDYADVNKLAEKYGPTSIKFEEELSESKDDWKPTVVYVESEDDGDESDEPQVISFEEFSEDHDDYAKITITYYQGDDTLADENDGIVDDVTALIGDEAFTNFGNGSRDNNVVYIRNDSISTDFEVIRDPGKFSVIILGIEEPKKPRTRKMKAEE